MELEFSATPEDAGKRLDAALTEWLVQFSESEEALVQVPSRSRVAEWIKSGLVTVRGQTLEKPSHRVRGDETVLIALPAPEPLRIEPDAQIKIDILYEDEELLVLNKPAGLVVHPGAGNRRGTLVHGLAAYFGSLPQAGEASRPGIVHRLDKDTSGAMVVAKTDRSYHELVRQFLPPRQITRKYLALTRRLPRGADPVQGSIDAPIGRHLVDRKKMAVRAAGGKPSVTHWRIVEQLSHGSLLQIELETGRTHQIRVHLAHAKAPIVGDAVYGEPASNFPAPLRKWIKSFGRQALHAQTLDFKHPRSGERLHLETPMPADMELLLTAFRAESSC